jgi:hypothetical protein
MTALEDALQPAGDQRSFHGPGAPDGKIVDFWRWGFSNLLTNTTRGVFADWMVARLLGLSTPQRVEWDACDLVTPEGVRIEVKSGSYRQVWHKGHPPSKIVFSGLRARPWSADTGYSPAPSCNAHLYVFCVQTETDLARWDAFDLNQWRFYVLRNDEVAKLNQASIGLATLRRLAKEMDAPTFQARMLREIAELSTAAGVNFPSI